MCNTSVKSPLRDAKVTDHEVKKEMDKMEKEAMQGLLWHEWAMWAAGSLLLLVLLPLTATTVASTVLWDALDRGFRGEPLDGVLCAIVRWYNKKTHFFTKRFVRKEVDSFLVNVVLLLGVVIPLTMLYCLFDTLKNGFNPYLCIAFHIFRLGPYFMNFAHCYANCHKECHNKQGIFKGTAGKLLPYVFNWWIGLFYGVLPSSFAFGHAINHHKYNNGPQDVLSTSDKPRDSFRNFVCYLPRQFLYAINVSTVIQFIVDGEYSTALWMNIGNIYYVGWVYLFYHFSPVFALWYVLLPLGENVLLLACINWCWHGFLNHKDPEDDYVGSITILDGPINVEGEDYHVVHHRFPGLHWEDHEAYYNREVKEGKYSEGPASVFRKTHAFEMFFLIILREYDQMAERMVDMRGPGNWTFEDKKNAIKLRLRTCWWGPRRNLSIKLTGREVRK